MPARSSDTYLFIDGEYQRRIYREAMQSFFKCDGEINFPMLKQQAVAKRAFFYDCLDDVKRSKCGTTDARLPTNFLGPRNSDGRWISSTYTHGAPTPFDPDLSGVELLVEIMAGPVRWK